MYHLPGTFDMKKHGDAVGGEGVGKISGRIHFSLAFKPSYRISANKARDFRHV
jgi:hypothetical protein